MVESLLIGFIGVPIFLTISNVIFLFWENKIKPTFINVVDFFIFGFGILFSMILISLCSFEEWYVQLYNTGGKYTDGGTYTPISFESLPTFIVICFIAILGLVLLKLFYNKLSPIIASLCYAAVFLGIVMTVALTVQMWCDIKIPVTLLLLLFPYNCIICAVRIIRKTASMYAKQIEEAEYKNRFLRFCKTFLNKSTKFVLFSFLLSVPLLIVVIIVLLLFGQQPDSIIKAFTNTAEWTLSQKIPPPRLDYSGHYLCTVAAYGDEKIVKPLRAGKRRGSLIVVNRQLLVANAFEDLIAEKTPKFHKLIRGLYDKIGLPISKYITTKKRSNIVYFVMKPLEWIFLLVLYTCDIKPENRINKQYIA